MKDAPRRGTLWGAIAAVPDRRPGWCETCRTRPVRRVSNVELLPVPLDGYCSELCALFDVALSSHTTALGAADGDPLDAVVVLTRTKLRLVVDVYDDVFVNPPSPFLGGVAQANVRANRREEWRLDVAAGRVLPLGYDAAVGELRAQLGLADTAR